jgi:hypothetical protein
MSSAAPDFESSLEDPAAMLAADPNRMSMQEKEQVLYEAHGVAEAMEDEQPDFCKCQPRSVRYRTGQDPRKKPLTIKRYG